MWAVIALLGAAATFLLFTGGIASLAGTVRRRVESYEAEAQVQLAAARISTVTPQRLLQISAGIGFVVFVLAYVFSKVFWISVIVGALAATLPRRWLAQQRAKRLATLEEQLPDAVDQLVSSVRAGLSLPQAISEAAASTPRPMSEELLQIANEERAGRPLAEAIEAARVRIGGRGFPLVAAALRVSLEKGGNLPQALQRISESLKEIWRLEQRLLTASAEARKAVKVICWLPIGIAAMVFLIQPDLALTLTSTALGWLILFVVGVVYMAGLGWMNRIIQPDV